MYNQYPEEGAWLECKISIFPDKNYNIVFNYDDYENFTSRTKDAENLVQEFRAYPRSKEFTPQWWQDLLGRKAKYLK